MGLTGLTFWVDGGGDGKTDKVSDEGEEMARGDIPRVPARQAYSHSASDLNLADLSKLKADGKASSFHSLFTAEQAALVLKTLESTAGVNVISAPRVQTLEGRQAVVSITEQKMVAGQEHTLGPSLDVETRIAADGSSVNLTVSARLRKANPAQ